MGCTKIDIWAGQARDPRGEGTHEQIGTKSGRTYDNIPNTAQRDEIIAVKKIDHISQVINITLTTPPEVREQRKKEEKENL
jgi:hypothetical protein